MSGMSEVGAEAREEAHEEAEEYRSGAPRPLAGYAVVLAAFSALVVGAVGLTFATGRRVPSDVRVRDLVLLTIGTHKLSRMLTKDPVTSPLRSPFTRFQETGGPAEVNEEVRRASQLRHAIGEMVTCPFCVSLWIATGFAIGVVFAPRFTRLVAATFSMVAGSDFLQLAYSAMQSKAE